VKCKKGVLKIDAKCRLTRSVERTAAVGSGRLLLGFGNSKQISTPDDSELFSMVKEIRSLYPDWRLGQMVCNVAVWAHEPDKSSVGDIEDGEFIRAARGHIEKRKSDNGQPLAEQDGPANGSQPFHSE
jgi:hypothetical protein